MKTQIKLIIIIYQDICYLNRNVKTVAEGLQFWLNKMQAFICILRLLKLCLLQPQQKEGMR